MLSFEPLIALLITVWIGHWGVKTFLAWIHPGLAQLFSLRRLGMFGFHTTHTGFRLLKWSAKGAIGLFRFGGWLIRLPRHWARQRSLLQLALQDRIPCSVCHQDIPLIPAIRTCPGCRSNLALCHVLEECPHCKHRLTHFNCPHCSVTMALYPLKKSQ